MGELASHIQDSQLLRMHAALTANDPAGVHAAYLHSLLPPLQLDGAAKRVSGSAAEGLQTSDAQQDLGLHAILLPPILLSISPIAEVEISPDGLWAAILDPVASTLIIKPALRAPADSHQQTFQLRSYLGLLKWWPCNTKLSVICQPSLGQTKDCSLLTVSVGKPDRTELQLPFLNPSSIQNLAAHMKPEFSPNARHLKVVSSDQMPGSCMHQITVYDTETGQRRAFFKGMPGRRIHTGAVIGKSYWRPDSAQLIVLRFSPPDRGPRGTFNIASISASSGRVTWNFDIGQELQPTMLPCPTMEDYVLIPSISKQPPELKVIRAHGQREGYSIVSKIALAHFINPQPVFSPDGQWIAALVPVPRSVTKLQLKVWNVRSQNSWLVPINDRTAHIIVWAPDSARLALHVLDSDAKQAIMTMFDPATGASWPMFSVATLDMCNLQWTKDSATLLYISNGTPEGQANGLSMVGRWRNGTCLWQADLGPRR